jgi:hypothetical protein
MIQRIRKIIKNSPLSPFATWLILTYLELRSPVRSRVFRQTIKKILRDPDILRNEKILSDLSYGWGNRDYAASIEYLKDCIEYTTRSKLPILECGSGLTTIIAGIIAQQSGNSIWSLEHTYLWFKKTQRYLKKFGIKSVKLYYCPPLSYDAFSWIETVRLYRYPPLDHGTFFWYDFPANSMPDKFSLVICDGHAGGNMGGQYCVFPIMKQRFTSGCVILFDIAKRENEEVYMSHWAQALNMTFKIRGENSRHFLIEQK